VPVACRGEWGIVAETGVGFNGSRRREGMQEGDVGA
jgi:hypothetical protein